MKFSKEKVALFALATLAVSYPIGAQAASTKERFPLTVSSGGFATKIQKIPHRIISLSPTATENLFAIGAGAQVIAVDSLSNFPSNAPITKLSAFTPNVEAIAAKKPDLVILSVDSTNSKSVRKSLEMLKIAVLMEKAPNQISDAYIEIAAIGKATDKVANAASLISKMKATINSIVASSRKATPITFFHELDSTLYTATSSTFIGKVYADFNLANIGDKAQGADSSGYPQLSQEYLVVANPQIIFLSDAQYGENLETVSKRAGWSGISAVSNARVVSLPADIPSRWGPRLVDFYRFIAQAIANIS